MLATGAGRLFALSDLHVDFDENRVLLEQLSRVDHVDDALIVAGDVGHRSEQVELTMELLQERFAQVHYVPGNHELWVQGEDLDSVAKFELLLELCGRRGVHVGPARCGTLWVVPLYAWYDGSLETGADPAEVNGWADLRYCRWPHGLGDPARFFAARSAAHLRSYPGPVVSFSHFVPRRDLLPPPVYLRYSALPLVAGSALIETQVRELGSVVHVFGHSHISRDVEHEGVRYVQRALGYPRERRDRPLVLEPL